MSTFDADRQATPGAPIQTRPPESRRGMIGPVESHEKMYTAACGQVFADGTSGREHETWCMRCSAALAELNKQDMIDNSFVLMFGSDRRWRRMPPELWPIEMHKIVYADDWDGEWTELRIGHNVYAAFSDLETEEVDHILEAREQKSRVDRGLAPA